jgi:hypothetical protein
MYMNCTTELKHLCEVSRSLYFLTLPYLYESLCLEPDCGEDGLEGIDVEYLLPAMKSGHLLYTRDIEIMPNYRHNIFKGRTLDQIYSRDKDDSNDEGGKIVEFGIRMIPLFEALEEGKLLNLK